MGVLKDNDQLKGLNGQKIVNFNPVDGVINVYRSLPDFSYSNIPYRTFDVNTPENELVLIIPVRPNLSWLFKMTNNAEVSYDDYE